mmetsp:Transcript_2634/g.5343  ORF Transcript_2634/g.5343 Transcript_2634/m.5343 type:complete len:263 (-) Transcript_2634:2767-3555(-)
MCYCLDNSSCPLGRVTRLENSRSNKDTIHSELHHEGCICWCCNTASSKVDHWKPSKGLGLSYQLNWSTNFFGVHIQLIVIHILKLTNSSLDSAGVSDSLNHIASSSLPFCANHCSSLSDPPQSFTQISAATHKWHLEVVLVNVVDVICRSQNLRFVDVIDTQSFQDLGLHKVSNASLCHDWDGNSLFNTFDHRWIAHSRHTTFLSDIRWNSFQCHHSDSSCFFGNASLLWSHDVHNDSTLEHLGQSSLHCVRSCLISHCSQE